MVLARIAKFYFKKGKREEGFARIDQLLSQKARNLNGFRGFISFLSKDDKNEAFVITLWQDESALVASEKSLFASSVKEILDLLEKEPTVEHAQLYSTEMLQRPE